MRNMKRLVVTFFGTTILNYFDLPSFYSPNFAKVCDKILLEVNEFLMSLFLNHSKNYTYCAFANIHTLLKFLNLILVITFLKSIALFFKFLQR